MKTVLLIEDNLDVRETTMEILELAGFKVVTANNGKEPFESSELVAAINKSIKN